MFREQLAEQLKENHIRLTEEQIDKLTIYSEEILTRNESVNLTAVRDPQSFITRNLIDSLVVRDYLRTIDGPIADIGTGGGFPGIPLAVYFPDKTFTLIDATQKKLDAVEEAAKKAGITNVRFVCARAEDIGRDGQPYRCAFSCVLTRAVASLRMLVELCTPLLKIHGKLIALKSSKYKEEIEEAKPTLEIMNCKIQSVHTIDILNSDMLHVIIIVEKNGKTPLKFPRSYAQIKKKPLS